MPKRPHAVGRLGKRNGHRYSVIWDAKSGRFLVEVDGRPRGAFASMNSALAKVNEACGIKRHNGGKRRHGVAKLAAEVKGMLR